MERTLSCECQPRSKHSGFWQPFFSTALDPRGKPEDDGGVFRKLKMKTAATKPFGGFVAAVAHPHVPYKNTDGAL